MNARIETTCEFTLCKQRSHVITGIVYRARPERDSQGDRIEPDELAKMAYSFLQNPVIKLNHEKSLDGRVRLIESWVTQTPTRIGDQTAPANSWVISVEVEDPAVWNMVRAGQLRSFSLAGRCIKDDQGRMADVRLDEVSLVERGANLEGYLVAKAAPMDDQEELRARVEDFCRRFNEFLNSEMVTSKNAPKPVLRHDDDPATFVEQEGALDYAQRQREKNSWAEESELARQNREVFRRLYGR